MPKFHVYMTVEKQECYEIEAVNEEEALKLVEDGGGEYCWSETGDVDVTHAEEVEDNAV